MHIELLFMLLYLFQHRLNPRIFINEFHDLAEIIPQVQHFDTYGSKRLTGMSAFFRYTKQRRSMQPSETRGAQHPDNQHIA